MKPLFWLLGRAFVILTNKEHRQSVARDFASVAAYHSDAIQAFKEGYSNPAPPPPAKPKRKWPRQLILILLILLVLTMIAAVVANR